MHTSDFTKSLNSIDVEDFMSWLGIDYRLSSGSSGVQLNIRQCPRCGGIGHKTYIGSDSGLGNCFHGSCVGEPGFNLFTFTEHYTGSKKETFKEINRYLEETGWRPKKPPKEKPTSEPAFFDSSMIPHSVALPFKSRNLKYLADRNFTAETVEHFQWRYCVEGYYTYRDDLGEFKQQDYSRRVIIPVHDMNGGIVTFQGRSIDAHSDTKYLFPPKLPGTGRYLYNAHNAIGASRIIVGEGVFDVAAIYQAVNMRESLKDMVPVGTFGKHLSTSSREDGDDQMGAFMRLKKDGLREIVFMWDGELSALDAACKMALLVRKAGFITKVAALPNGKDPNEVEPEEIIRAIHNAFDVSPATVNKFRLAMRKSSK